MKIPVSPVVSYFSKTSPVHRKNRKQPVRPGFSALKSQREVRPRADLLRLPDVATLVGGDQREFLAETQFDEFPDRYHDFGASQVEAVCVTEAIHEFLLNQRKITDHFSSSTTILRRINSGRAKPDTRRPIHQLSQPASKKPVAKGSVTIQALRSSFPDRIADVWQISARRRSQVIQTLRNGPFARLRLP
jgi:hypothetical protein